MAVSSGKRPASKVVSAGTTASAAATKAVLPAGLVGEAVRILPPAALAGALRNGLGQLVGLSPVLTSTATQQHDGRLARLVLLTIEDRLGKSRPGITVHLLDMSGRIVDRARTSRSGLAILAFPTTTTPTQTVGGPTDATAARPDLPGAIQILDGSAKGIEQQVVVPAGSQFADLTVVLDTLPDAPVAPASAGTVLDDLWPPAGVGEDPLSRLPADFTPEFYEAIVRKLDLEGDSLLGTVASGDDFRSQRTPLIKRLSVVRNGTQQSADTGLTQYMVRVRQSWNFLGYTLGELAQVDALDPGEILDETVGTVENTVEQVNKLVQQARSLATSSLFDTLQQNSKIDTLVNAATSTEAYAAAAGFAIGIPGLFGAGGMGATAGVNTSATTSTHVDTSLQVNHLLNTAQSFVNQAIQSATSTLTSLARTITSKLGRVSPLLSRVTNLLRWHVYENYAVNTQIEDILELVKVQILAIPQGVDVFTDLEIVEYRRFFEPALLDPALRGRFPALESAVQQRLAGGGQVSRVEIEVNYGTSLATGHLLAEINGATVELSLLPGGTRARGTITFDQPVDVAAITSASLTLTASTNLPNFPMFGLSFPDSLLTVDVHTCSLWVTGGYGDRPDTVQPLGNTLHLQGSGGSASTSFPFTVAPPNVDTAIDPLFRHINHNPSYYVGVLAQSALLYPSLREDCGKLAGVPAAVWQLPIIGVEGDHIIVAKDADPTNPDVIAMLADEGAATLVQLAASGVYSEALQGLLSLTDAEKLIHPKLLAPPAPAMPPIALVDLTGNQLVPIPTNGSAVPTGSAVPVGTGATSGTTGILGGLGR